MHNVVTVVQSL